LPAQFPFFKRDTPGQEASRHAAQAGGMRHDRKSLVFQGGSCYNPSQVTFGKRFQSLNAIMSRFVNLEFGDEHEDHSHDHQKGLLKGEAHYFAEATAAFENGEFEPALRR
jgi:hypothetical protein